MAETTGNQFIVYNGIFRHGVDEKRRVQVPARWRPAEAEMEFTLIVWPNATYKEASLLVLPPQEMLALLNKVRQMSLADPETQSLRRLLGSKSANVSLDKGGRICLPEDMARKVDVKDEAVLVGHLDRFEIWNPERYKEVEKADETLLPQAFKLI